MFQQVVGLVGLEDLCLKKEFLGFFFSFAIVRLPGCNLALTDIFGKKQCLIKNSRVTT